MSVEVEDTMSMQKKFLVKLPEDVLAKIGSAAIAMGISKSAIIKIAIAEYLGKPRQ